MSAAWMREARRRQSRARSWDNPALSHGGLAWQAREALVDQIRAVPWHDYDTLTLVLGKAESYWFLLRRHLAWTRRLEDQLRCRLRQVVAMEPQKRGTWHAHLLSYGNHGRIGLRDRHELWKAVSGGGFAWCRDFDATRGAAAYCAKYVTKDCEVFPVGPWAQMA